MIKRIFKKIIKWFKSKILEILLAVSVLNVLVVIIVVGVLTGKFIIPSQAYKDAFQNEQKVENEWVGLLREEDREFKMVMESPEANILKMNPSVQFYLKKIDLIDQKLESSQDPNIFHSELLLIPREKLENKIMSFIDSSNYNPFTGFGYALDGYYQFYARATEQNIKIQNAYKEIASKDDWAQALRTNVLTRINIVFKTNYDVTSVSVYNK